MRFDINEKVKVKTTGRIDTISQSRKVENIINGEKTETYEYYIKSGTYYGDWYKEDQLISLDNFDNKFELGLLNLLIDVNLKVNKLDVVEDLHLRKQQYTS